MRARAVGALVAALSLLLAGCGTLGDPCAFVEVDAGRYGDVPVAYFTTAPADDQGRPRFFLASEAGGLWVTTLAPTGPQGSGFTVPLNDVARTESEVGVEATVPPDLDPGDDRAQEAVRCAAEGPG